ncbi:hypothetical protein Tco_0548695 [Tanacetum coccineum]
MPPPRCYHLDTITTISPSSQPYHHGCHSTTTAATSAATISFTLHSNTLPPPSLPHTPLPPPVHHLLSTPQGITTKGAFGSSQSTKGTLGFLGTQKDALVLYVTKRVRMVVKSTH